MQTRQLPKTLYRADQVRELDRLAIEARGIPGIQLMKRAGRAAYEALRRCWPEGPLTVFCGAGNNGGDGYIIAALAQQQRRSVKLVQLVERDKLKGDALLACEFAEQVGVTMAEFSGESMPGEFIPGEGVIVDALLGTGLRGEVREPYGAVIQQINDSGLPVLAVDIPSGLSADSGAALGAVINAALTVSFIGLKQGLFTGRGPDCCGELVYSDLGVPEDIFSEVPSQVRRLSLDDFRPALGRRPRHSHKGNFGHVLVIGGDSGFGGAVAMAAEAALRVGAGLVSVATREQHIAPLLARRPELMVRAVNNGSELEPLLANATVLVVGPGLGRSAWSQQLLQRAIASELPMVLDADGLNILATQSWPGKAQWLITPHPGEAARLLGITAAEVQHDRFAAVTALHTKYGCRVALKGAGTLVYGGLDEGVGICTAGNPGMASGGMGDVLSGVIGGLVAQGIPLDDALAAGVCLHSTAADSAARQGERGLLATDLFTPLKELVNPC